MEFTKDIQFNSNPKANETITIHYQGFLKDSAKLVIVYGFGESWEHTTEDKMEKTSEGFSAQIKLLNFDTLNFCFRDNHGVWDNNSNCNYISSISPSCQAEEIGQLFDALFAIQEEPEELTQKFDIDALIEELLQPILVQSEEKAKNITPAEIQTNPVDLGAEISRILSEINYETSTPELVEYNTLDEILSGTVISESPVELEETSVDAIVSELIENTVTNKKTVVKPSISEEQFANYVEIDKEITNIIQKIEEEEHALEENSLVVPDNSFVISPRQLSKFYLFRKRLKLAFYKALVKIPKLIFGLEEH